MPDTTVRFDLANNRSLVKKKGGGMQRTILIEARICIHLFDLYAAIIPATLGKVLSRRHCLLALKKNGPGVKGVNAFDSE